MNKVYMSFADISFFAGITIYPLFKGTELIPPLILSDVLVTRRMMSCRHHGMTSL